MHAATMRGRRLDFDKVNRAALANLPAILAGGCQAGEPKAPNTSHAIRRAPTAARGLSR